MISLILIFGFLCQSSIFRYATAEKLDVHGELIIGILVSLVVGHLNVVLQLQLLLSQVGCYSWDVWQVGRRSSRQGWVPHIHLKQQKSFMLFIIQRSCHKPEMLVRRRFWCLQASFQRLSHPVWRNSLCKLAFNVYYIVFLKPALYEQSYKCHTCRW